MINFFRRLTVTEIQYTGEVLGRNIESGENGKR